jgi:hypothetical protein
MSLQLPQPQFMPCPECGASVAHAEWQEHVCDRERWLDYSVFHLRSELDGFESDFAGYLTTPQGRFAAWYAARRRAA